MADLEVRERSDAATEAPAPDRRRPGRRTLYWIIGLLAGFVVYAYAYQETQVDLGPITDERRQEQLFRVLRALGSPDLLTYETTDTVLDLDYQVPCPEGPVTAEVSEGPISVSVDPPCAAPRDRVVVTGSGFVPNTGLRVFFVPPSDVQLRLTNTRTNPAGDFEEEVLIPNRPDTEAQTIRVVSRQRVGSVFDPVFVETAAGEEVRSPRWSENAKQTLDKIIETVFLALLATTVGTLIAVPLSFLAARNLMRDVRIPPLQVATAVLALPVGAAIGFVASEGSRALISTFPASALLLGGLTVALVWGGARLTRMSVPAPGSPASRGARVLAALAAAVTLVVATQALARFAQLSGAWLADNTGPLAFLGRFIATNGNILATFFGVLAAIAGAVALGFLGSRLGYAIGRRLPPSGLAILTVIAAVAAGALVALGVGQVISWLYQVSSLRRTVIIPMVAGGLLGAIVGAWSVRKGQIGAGLGVYYISRTVFNALRSIEPLVMAIVFVIWVGLGPFAGSLALGLHTVAALAKLYSEQVESINPGPVEAIRATGATRLQTVVYAVVPQIVAPYISFTMYRWDINVRMSTIIGFVGGGGIGFLLQQNIGLLNYEAAAAQMLAIAIVVATMDYISSRLRERFT
ncbi:MAG: ABC transporter permease subunit [Acidimicrobiia bacterium]